MILTCDDRDGPSYVFTFTTNILDPVRFNIGDTENAETMSEVLRHLAEYAEAVEDAVQRQYRQIVEGWESEQKEAPKSESDSNSASCTCSVGVTSNECPEHGV